MPTLWGKSMRTLLDTNCILRYLLADVPGQAERVGECIEKGASTAPEFLSECVFVLSGKVYGFGRAEVSDALSAVLDEVECEHAAAMQEALRMYRSTALDFPDCILAARHAVEGVPVMTFDRKLSKLLDSLERE